MLEDKAFSSYMNPSIMRILINFYEMNKSKGLSDDDLYELLVSRWESAIGIGLDRLLARSEIKMNGFGSCGPAATATAEIKKEVCCGGDGRGSDIVTTKSGSCCGGGRGSEKVTTKSGRCCGDGQGFEKVTTKSGSCCGDGRGSEEVTTKSGSCCGGGRGSDKVTTKGGSGSCYMCVCVCGSDCKIEKRGCSNTESGKKNGRCSCECGPPKRIFVVDDSLVSCKITKKVLENCGHSSTLCTNGSEAMNMLTKASLSWGNNDGFPFDMLFLDIVMPVTDGIELLGHIKSMPHLVNIPVVMLSGLEDDKLARKCIEMGAVSVVQKPLKCQHVKNLLGSIEPCKINHEELLHAAIPPPIILDATPAKTDSRTLWKYPGAQSPRSPLDSPIDLEVGSIAPIHSIMVCNPKGRMVPAIPPSRVSVILLLPRCGSKSESMNDLVYMVLDVARAQGRVGGAVSLIFITREEENVVLPSEIRTYSFVSLVTVDEDAWKAFLGVSHTFTCGLLVLDGEGAVVFSWSGLVDFYGELYEIEKCVSKDELMNGVHRAARRTLLGTSATVRRKCMKPSSCDLSLESSKTPSTLEGSERFTFGRTRSMSIDLPEEFHINMFRILVVDDSLMSCKLCVRKLQMLGFSAEYVKNGKVAIETLGKRPNDFDLVLLDIVMPVVDGFEVLSQIKSDSVLCNIPVIMLSGLGEDQVLSKHCLDLGAMMVLCKPLVEKEVEEIINQMLTLRPRSPQECVEKEELLLDSSTEQTAV